MKKHIANKGFTFVELMIAITIFSIIAISIYSAFGTGIRVWRQGENSIAFNQDLRLALEDLAVELKNAINYSQDDPLLGFNGLEKEIRFLTLLNQEGGRKLCVVSYFINEEKGGILSFKRAQADQLAGFEIDKSKGEIVISNISDVSFSYAYDTKDEANPYEWLGVWENSKIVPRGIKVFFKIKNPDNKASEEVYTKMIFIPSGTLGEKT